MTLKKSHMNHSYGKKRFGKKKLIFLSFLLVLGIILCSTFYLEGGITGRVVSNLNKSDLINIQSSLSIPEVSLNGEYEEVIIFLEKDNAVILDKKEISLNEIENKIILKNFSGKIEFNEDYINKLEGKVSEIRINNLPIYLQTRGKIKFSLPQSTQYSSFEISEGIHLGDVSFISSGSLAYENDVLNLNSEKIRFENYFGNLRVHDKKLILEGNDRKINIDGELRKKDGRASGRERV